jgi:hypothetical protein
LILNVYGCWERCDGEWEKSRRGVERGKGIEGEEKREGKK